MLLAETDWGNVCFGVAAIISAIGSAVAAIYAARAHAASVRNELNLAKNTEITERVEVATNGMKNELVESVRADALQAGEIKGRAAEIAEQKLQKEKKECNG